MSEHTIIHEAIKSFAETVTTKMSQLTRGEPEDQLRGPFEIFITDVANDFGWKAVCTGETKLSGRLGKPDYAVHVDALLSGYVELKQPGRGADARKYRGHDKDQFDRFTAIPNILYTDGNEWALYREGDLEGRLVRLSGDVSVDGKNAASPSDAASLEHILRNFLTWEPILPTRRNGQVDVEGLAKLLAPICRLLRDDVSDAIKDSSSPLVQLAGDWRQLLFPDASDARFADSYAQTVTFALLLGRSEGADPLTLASAETALASNHSLLSRALKVLTDPNARDEISASLDLLLRIINVVPPGELGGDGNPWLYFYEDFLSEYDAELRKDAGVYYTPVEVVHCQVRLIHDLLVDRLGKPLGFSDSGVITLDPAVGTGTYLLGVIEHALSQIEEEQGSGAVAGQATALAERIYGFEIMVGPYSVSELRISRALSERGAKLPIDGTHVYLTDTLESPFAQPLQAPFFLQPIADQHTKAIKVKNEVPVIVCLGNPPYDRHEAATEENKAKTGGWVRWGEEGSEEKAILADFIEPALEAEHGVHIKNLYNLYVYFWRWALWKVFEHELSEGPGIVSFISASSFLDGDAFCGMREHLRRLCDEVWIIDLGGEGRGTRQSDNIFSIQTPVCITIAYRSGESGRQPAKLNYTEIRGDTQEKLSKLESVRNFSDLTWEDCAVEWQAPFRPEGKGDYFNWPLLTDLLPWQHSGVQLKRTWPIAPTITLLEQRWKRLLEASDRAELFRETDDRRIHSSYNVDIPGNNDPTPIAKLPNDSPMPKPWRYAYRSFDRQWIIADGRLMSRWRPPLWSTYSDQQIYLTSLLTKPLGSGPAVTASALVPDLDHFSGRGAKDTIPLYRTSNNSEPNLLPGLLELLMDEYKHPVTVDDFVAYVYGILAQQAFTEIFFKELETRELHVPITKDASYFSRVKECGEKLLWLHTFGQRFIPKGKPIDHGILSNVVDQSCQAAILSSSSNDCSSDIMGTTFLPSLNSTLARTNSTR